MIFRQQPFPARGQDAQIHIGIGAVCSSRPGAHQNHALDACFLLRPLPQRLYYILQYLVSSLTIFFLS